MFGRFSWNDGRSEISAFTDIDASLSIKGTAWGRPDDRIGIAGVLNQISADHANYLAAGGLGILVGDGALTYASENIIEIYYAFQLRKGLVDHVARFPAIQFNRWGRAAVAGGQRPWNELGDGS
jgi:high affinity Mn2+ porin